jgi:hypothetical protein
MFKNSIKTLFSIAAVIAFLLLQGCAAPKVNLTSQDRLQLKKQKSIKAVHIRSGWPTLKTPMGVIASDLTLGLSEDWTEGQKLVKKFKIKDPSMLVKKEFIRQVNHKRKVANFVNITTPLAYKDREVEELAKKYKKGVVLQIEPGTWQIWYYPFNWARYQMWFRAGAKLVRLEDKKVLWSAFCKANQDNADTAPTLDELTADNSKVLYNWVNKASAQCATQLVNDFMGRKPKS